MPRSCAARASGTSDPALRRRFSCLAAPIEFTLELTPRARVDVIDVRGEVFSRYGDALDRVSAGALLLLPHDGRLSRPERRRAAQSEPRRRHAVHRCLPDDVSGRGGLRARQDRAADGTVAAQRPSEPLNADSHLAFMAGALRTCVVYLNRPGEPMSFIDLDGVHAGRPRTRRTSVIGYSAEETVAQARVVVPVSGHSVESVNLKDPRLGVYEQCAELVAQHGVTKGRIRLSLAPGRAARRADGQRVRDAADAPRPLGGAARSACGSWRRRRGTCSATRARSRPRRSTTRSTISSACSTGWSMRSACASRSSRACCRGRSRCRRPGSCG